MIANMVQIDDVPRMDSQRANHLTVKRVHHLEIIGDVKCPIVEPDVIIRAEAKHVAFHVRTSMLSPQWSYMRPLAVGADIHFDDDAAHLASVLVPSLDVLDHLSAANGLAHSGLLMRCRSLH